jgi:ABC-type dipeptide/oligopeptide/nickel transport system permease component
VLKYAAGRITAAIPVIFGLITIVFFMMRLLPGDPVSLLLTEFAAAAEDQEQIRRQLGLDDPLIVQYGRYLGNLAQGDMGTSVFTKRPVLDQIRSQLPATLELAAASTVIGVVGGLLIGVFAAAWRGSAFDRISLIVSLFFISMPSFWVGLLFIYFFALRLGWFPVAGTGGWDHLVLPALALGLRPIAVLSRVVRASMLEVLRNDYIVTARAKGLGGRRVLFGHALRNALIPVITIIGIQFGFALGGSVIIETVFGRQGVGFLAVGAVQKHDYPLVQGTVLFIGIVVVLVNLLVDLLYGLVDPRIRYS